jgi:adenylate cyclase
VLGLQDEETVRIIEPARLKTGVILASEARDLRVRGLEGAVIYRFGTIALDTELLELSSAQGPVTLEPQVFSLLAYLIENRSHVVSRQELIDTVWEGRIVSDDTLNSRINAARRAVGDTGTAQAIIRTLPRRGFRFVAEIDVLASPPPGRVLSANDLPASAGPEVPLQRQKAPLLLPDRPSIAVLAFANLSGDKEQEYLSDGITEDIITELSRFSELFVIARNSSFQYKGKATDVREVGRDLGVRYVLEGSVRRGGDRLRISAQLIDAVTGGHRWAERYDRKLEDVFAVQDEIVRTIVPIIAAHVRKAETERTRAKPPNSWQSYDYYLQAVDAFASSMSSFSVQDLNETRRLLQASLAIDPNYARSHAVLSTTYLVTWGYPINSEFLNSNALDHAHQLARKAVQLDENLPAARGALGGVLLWLGEHEASLAEFERAIVLNPNYVSSRFGAALMYAGYSRRAVDVLEAYMRLDPLYASLISFNLGNAHYMLKQYAQALPVLRECVARSPNYQYGHVSLAATYARLGQLDEARAAAAKVLRIQPNFTISGVARLVCPFKLPEDGRHFFDGLRLAGLPR